MKLKALFEDDGAVSPVIGVILMVAITVILAAVIGTFVLGLGDRVSDAQPNAQFSFEYAEGAQEPDAAATSNYVNITHDGGEGVEGTQLEVTIGGNTAWDNGAGDKYNTNGDDWQDSKLTAGSSVEIYEGDNDITDGQAVKVIWGASGSDKTAVIGESEVSL
jgi:flagellin-like protein